MTDIEKYLQSEQAREHLRMAQLALSWTHDGNKQHTENMDGVLATWADEAAGVWRRVSLNIDGAAELLCAYYGPDRDRFIVSDLCESVSLVMRRTGKELTTAWTAVSVARANAWARSTFADQMRDEPDLTLRGVGTQQLPDAICYVLLASHRAANPPRD